MNFCSHCGQPVTLLVPEGDHLQRHVCMSCGRVHYQNPRIIAGCVPEHEGRILLCRRAIEPRLGYWTIPAGFMENGETTQEAARREAIEEAEADVEIGTLLAVVHVVHADQVHMMFRAKLPAPKFGAGRESLEVRLYEAEDIPWDEIAFRSVGFALRRYLEDRRSGVEQHHFTSLDLRRPTAR